MGSYCENDETKLTSRQQLDHPLLEIRETNVESRRDNTSLVETAIQLYDNLARPMIINFLELADVSWDRVSNVGEFKRCTSRSSQRTCKILANVDLSAT